MEEIKQEVMNLELGRLRMPKSAADFAPKKKREVPRHRAGEHFLKGPIPMNWLNIAASLPGKALQVAVALWYGAGLKRSREVALSSTWLRKMGVDRFASYRGLAALEEAGLVTVERYRGRKPIVTLLDTPAPSISESNSQSNAEEVIQ